MTMNSTLLAHKAMLVKLTVRRVSFTRKDPAAESLLHSQLEDQSLTVLQKLFRDKSNPINQIMKAVNEVYTYHRKHTLPWSDKGPRILPNQLYFEYTEAMRHRIAAVDKMVADALPKYDEYVQMDIEARSRGVAPGAPRRAQVSDYPTAEEFALRTGFELRFSPMPDKRHFLFDLSPEDEASFERSMEEVAQAARDDAVDRMLAPLRHLANKLSVPIGEEGSIFRDSAIRNVIEGIEVAQKLMLHDDPELKALADRLSQVMQGCADRPESLRESPAVRMDAARQLKDIEEKMAAFMGVPPVGHLEAMREAA